MNVSSHKNAVSNLVESFMTDGKDADVVFIGSLRAAAESAFHPTLSDIDVLIVPSSDSLDSHVSHFERAIEVARRMNSRGGWLADVFVMSRNLAHAHYSCLSVYAGDVEARAEDFIVANGYYDRNFFNNPSQRLKKKLYAANAARACRDYGLLLPVVDTREARKISKRLLRLLKVIICAHADVESVNDIEKTLFQVKSFEAIIPIFEVVVGKELEIGCHLVVSLSGEETDDWPGLMIDQSNLGYFLQTIDFSEIISLDEERLYGDLGKIIRELLTADLKDIICATDEQRDGLIKKYVDSATSTIVRLALSGVDSLADLESEETPDEVKGAYRTVGAYLQGGELAMKHLAAATILLEYAFLKGYHYCHDQL